MHRPALAPALGRLYVFEDPHSPYALDHRKPHKPPKRGVIRLITPDHTEESQEFWGAKYGYGPKQIIPETGTFLRSVTFWGRGRARPASVRDKLH